MKVATEINDIVVSDLAPVRLDVINESHMHNVPAGSESHFKLVIVSDAFSGKPLIARHRVVNKLLESQLKNDIHALSMHTYTPDEWEARGGDVPASPPCLGGKARES
jgi:BolA family transcriptional regulator, general stress-responsive regulator